MYAQQHTVTYLHLLIIGNQKYVHIWDYLKIVCVMNVLLQITWMYII